MLSHQLFRFEKSSDLFCLNVFFLSSRANCSHAEWNSNTHCAEACVNPFRQMLVPAEFRWNVSAKESTANLVDCGRSLCSCVGDNHRVGPSCRLLLELPLPKLVLVPFQALLEGVPAPGPEPVAPKPVLVLHTFHNQPPPGLEGVPAPGSSCRLTGWKLSHDPGKRARQRPLAQEERSS